MTWRRSFSLVLLLPIAGCSGRKDGGGDPDTVRVPAAEKGATGEPANFACVGGVDPVSGGAAGTLPLRVLEHPTFSAPPPAPGVTVQRVDPVTTAAIDSPSAVTDSAGLTTLVLPTTSRVALRMTADSASEYLATTYFNLVTASTADTLTMLVIPADQNASLLDFLDVDPAEVEGGGTGAGTVLDCDGDPVRNAVVSIEGLAPVRVGYFANTEQTSFPTNDAFHTSPNGRFFLLGVTPGAAPLRVVAAIHPGPGEGEPTEPVAHTHVPFTAGEIGMLRLDPVYAP